MADRLWRGAPAVLLGIAITASLARSAPADHMLSGMVRNGAGEALGGVQIKAFLNGFPQDAIVSEPDGSYHLALTYDPTADSTVAVWWVAEGDSLVPAIALLQESDQARRLGLWSACIPRITGGAEMRFDPVLIRRGALVDSLRSARCAEKPAVAPQ